MVAVLFAEFRKLLLIRVYFRFIVDSSVVGFNGERSLNPNFLIAIPVFLLLSENSLV